MKPRIMLSVAIFISIFYAPFWITAALALVGMIFFKNYFEAPALALLMDFYYGTSEFRFFDIMYTSFLVSFMTLLLIEFIKDLTRSH